jgi:hypothetical protein
MPWSLVVLVDEDVVTGMMLGSGPNLGAERCQFLNNETGEDPFIKKKTACRGAPITRSPALMLSVTERVPPSGEEAVFRGEIYLPNLERMLLKAVVTSFARKYGFFSPV